MKNKRKDKYRKTKAKKKKRVFRKILLLIVIAIIAGGTWFGYKTYKNGGGLSGMIAAAVGHDENTKKDLKELKVLIMGVSTDIDSELTDTIMVASYNPNTQKANLLSIPRDTYTGTNIKTAVASKKINSLYNISRDPKKTLEAVNDITGLDIKYYVLVKTEALIELVDAIGGVEFDVPIDMNYDDPYQDLHIHLKKGIQKIDGNKAEQLLRFRHNTDYTTYPVEYGDNDLGRMRTQREFITAVLKQTLKPSNIFKIGQILEVANKNLITNLELSFVKDYVPYAVEFSTENLYTATLPGTTPDIKDTNNVSIFVVNKSETKSMIEEMFLSNETESTSSIDIQNNDTSSTTNNVSTKVTIELLNGSGDTQKLKTARQILERAGYNVKRTGETSIISKTIITNRSNLSDEKVKSIKDTLGVGSISTNTSNNSTVDLTIIIGKDFNKE